MKKLWFKLTAGFLGLMFIATSVLAQGGVPGDGGGVPSIAQFFGKVSSAVVETINGITQLNLTTLCDESGANCNTLSSGLGGMSAATYDPAAIAEQLVGLVAAQSLTNKTLNSTTNFIDADRIHLVVKNTQGTTVNKGEPVYASGFSVGQGTEVKLADADGAATFPAIGLVEDTTIANNAVGEITVSGTLEDWDTTGTNESEVWAAGEALYLSATTGELTNVRPTGTAEVQVIAKVLRAHAVNGSVLIQGAGRVNDTPNTVAAQVLATTPAGTQSITAVSDTINANTNSHYGISSDADYVMTSTPTIPDGGNDGQILFLHNTGSFTVDLQDESALTGSNIMVNGAESTVKVGGIMTLLWDDTSSNWFITSNPNTAAAGANATTLAVRNSSGGAIAAGKAVYIDGFNTGQGRPTISLADADAAGQNPAIGIAATAIGNNTNGDVITFGTALGLINTSTASVGDGVWLGTTAGEVVFVRPAIDKVQRIGTVSRVNAAGNIQVTGAGRENDNPQIGLYDEQSTPANPSANQLKVYSSDDGGVTRLTTLDSSGTESLMCTLGDNTFTGTQTMSSKAINEAKGGDIASATTTDIGAATGNFVDVTGTTTITGFGTVQAGTKRTVQFDGALLLTYNATSLILPSNANITTVAGDTLDAVSLGSGNWLVTNYERDDGTALVSAGGGNKTLWIPILAAAPGSFTAQSDAMLETVLVDADDTYGAWNWTTPDDFSSVVSLKFYWKTNTTSANMYAEFKTRAVTTDESVIAGGSSDSIAITTYASSSTAHGLNIIDVTAMINGLTISAGDLVGLTVHRNGAHANDTVNANAASYGWQLVYN